MQLTFSAMSACNGGTRSLTGGHHGHKIMVMSGRTAPRRRKRRSQPKDAGTSLGAATFKATCLDLMDRVRETGAEYVVTKHGTPVAKLVPYRHARPTSFFGSMKGTVLKYERPFDPIDAEYDINRS